MEQFKIYKNMIVLPQELFKALEYLGYENESTATTKRYIRKSHNSIIELKNEPIPEALMNIYFAGFSYRLYLQGVINDPHELAKLIEKQREEARENLELVASS